MFNLVATLDISASNGTQIITGLNNQNLMMSLSTSSTFRGGDLIERETNSGNTFKVRWVQASNKGVFIPLAYGDTELYFDVAFPGTTFNLELYPNYYQFTYEVKVYEKTLTQSQIDLAIALQIPSEFLNAIPPEYIQLLNGLRTMAQSDTRTAAAAILAAQTAADLANQTIVSVNDELNAVKSTVVSVTEDMVTQDSFSVVASDFVIVGDFYHAIKPLVKVSGSTPVQMSLTDSLGEEQGFSQLISPYLGDSMKACVELNASQFADNTYPLTFLVQGKRISTMAGGASIDLGNGDSARLVSGTLTVIKSDGSELILESGVVEAFFYSFALYTLNSSGSYSYYTMPGFSQGSSNLGNWAVASTGVPII